MSALIGIDLGTTNSALAVLDPTGRPSIVANAEGGNITPSVVMFEANDPNRVVVGDSAKQYAEIHPDNVFQGFKRQMSANAPLPLGGGQITPRELSSLVLRKLRQDAEATIGAISKAVITVPANFTEEARAATLEAGRMAGLNVTDIINEPTAALLYYSMSKPVRGRVLVYDFGGGTLDVTMAEVDGRDVNIICSRGDPRLGGLDFDGRLRALIESRFEKDLGERFDRTIHTLAKTPEEYKKQLSAREDVSVQVAGGRTGRAILKISRADFEAACGTLVSKADLLVDTVLDEAGCQPADVTDVFLVGGSSRIPLLRAHLSKTFGKEPICYVNPDEVVALGAAVYAGLKADARDLNAAQVAAVKALKLQEVANHFFGTISLDSEAAGGRGLLRNSIVIEKNEPLPCSKTETYYTVHDGQTHVRCRVTQAATRESDPDFVRVIWDGTLGPLPEGRPAGKEIRVTYGYDTNQMMHCEFVDVETGARQDVTLGVKERSGDEHARSIDRFLVE